MLNLMSMKAIYTSSSRKTPAIHVNLKLPDSNLLAHLEKQAVFDRYFIIAIAIALCGITCGLVIGYTVRWHLWQLAAVVGVSMLPLLFVMVASMIKYFFAPLPKQQRLAIEE